MGLPEAARVKRYIPFSDGRRDCVGQALGRLNYTSTLARLLGNFHFELAPEVLAGCRPTYDQARDHVRILKAYTLERNLYFHTACDCWRCEAQLRDGMQYKVDGEVLC